MPLLALDDVRQSTDFTCADAAVRCVLRYHRIAAAPRVGTPPDGADPRVIEQALRHLGLRVVSGEMRLADLDHFCQTGRPPICLVHWPEDADSHYVCLRGLSRGYAFFHDVWSGRGRRTLADFEAAWRARGRLNEAFRGWAVVGWLNIS